MTRLQKQALAEAMNKQAERHVRAMTVPFYWLNSFENGDGGQFADRDLQLARAEREAQKGKD